MNNLKVDLLCFMLLCLETLSQSKFKIQKGETENHFKGKNKKMS